MALLKLGLTPEGKAVLGGAFQMSDTHGLPLSVFIELAQERDSVLSVPHFFASAMEAGWDDVKTFSRIEEAFRDSGTPFDLERIKTGCIALFMRFDGKPWEMGRKMRLWLES